MDKKYRLSLQNPHRIRNVIIRNLFLPARPNGQTVGSSGSGRGRPPKQPAIAIAPAPCPAHIGVMTTPPVSLRVASYNIRKCVGLDRRRDPDRVLSVIASLDADVVAIQEADRRMGDRPATLALDRVTKLTGLVALQVATSEVSLGWHGNAVLVHPDISIDGVTRIVLPGLEPRGAVMVKARRDKQPFQIVAAHLGLTRRFRRQQLSVIAATIASESAQLPTVIAGDFNEWSYDRGLEPLNPGYVVHAPGLSFHAARPVAALDRFATGSGFEVRDAGVVDSGTARIASDHLPVWADLSFAA